MPEEESISSGPPNRHYTLLAGRISAERSTDAGNVRIDDDLLYSNLVRVMRETKGVDEPRTPDREPQKWVFGNLVELSEGDDRLIFGRLGKLRPTQEQGVFDWAAHDFTSRSIDTQTWTGYSNFIVDVPSRIILFEERPPVISERQFSLYFKRLYEAHTQGFHRIEINLMSSPVEIFGFVESLDKVTTVSAELWPANPHVDREFEALQREIEKARAARLKIRLENDKAGLNTEGTLASQAIALATKGYGDVTIVGTKAGQSLSITSTKKIVKEVLPRYPDEPKVLVVVFAQRLKDLKSKLERK